MIRIHAFLSAVLILTLVAVAGAQSKLQLDRSHRARRERI